MDRPGLAQLLATTCSGLIAGGTLYISAVEAPGRAKQTPQQQLTMWRATFPRAAAVFAPAGMLAFASLLGLGYATQNSLYYSAAVPFGCMGPFTAILIAQTNKRLMTMEEPKEGDRHAEEEVVNLVSKWARLHAVRVGMAVTGFVICICAMNKAKV